MDINKSIGPDGKNIEPVVEFSTGLSRYAIGPSCNE
jgi:hypothetical protein